jgi:ArsR family transcriptional regulator
MKKVINLFKLFSDNNRVRILLILKKKELCVCELMGVLGLSQSLISKNLSTFDKEGFLDSRKAGKLVYYKLKPGLTGIHKSLIEVLSANLTDDPVIKFDVEVAKLCSEFQSKVGKCDMDTLNEFKKERDKLHQKSN